MKWFTSDWHLSHEFVMKVSQRPWTDVNKMNRDIIDNMLSVLKPGDEMYHLGDLAWRRYSLDEFFNQLPRNVNFHWILGNHDRSWQPFKKRCASIGDRKKIKIGDNTVILDHYPMLTWDKSHFNSWMLYGHHHRNSHGTDKLGELARGKMLNVNLEFHDYMPYSEAEIAKIMAEKPDNWDLIPQEMRRNKGQ
jgi:calcineurin-like phosphoesterase family protein